MSRDQHSVGIVQPQTMVVTESLALESGQALPGYDIVYETYGTLNQDASNAVLICHALSGNHHAAGFHEGESKPGWWDGFIGPGKPIDTDHFFVVSLNNLGGCHGSTGPQSTNPVSGNPYGPDFPIITVKDWVTSQAQLADHLGVQQWAAVIGGSLGGMQALQWSIQYPDRLRHAIVIASAPKLSAQNIAFNEIARQAILSDPHYHHGYYFDFDTRPDKGLRIARMLGHVTYLSDDAMAEKFGRELKTGHYNFDFDVNFEVEGYLRHQGDSFVNRFDANTYLLMTKVLDYFDPAQATDGDLVKAFEPITAKFMLMAFTGDWRFSPKRSWDIVKALVDAKKDVSYAKIDAHHGHDAFLLPIPDYYQIFKTYLRSVAEEA